MHKLFTAIFIVFAISAFAQQEIKPEWLEKMAFRNVGPAGMSGRITGIDVDPTNDNRIFAAAASGGLWLSENGGHSWTCIFNNEATAGIGCVKIDPSNPSIIWVGTGEGNPRNSLTSGKGIYKSIDGGKHWQLMGLEATKNINRIAIDPRNSDVVYAAAIGVPWGDTPDRGVYKSTDGGQTWAKILFVDNQTGAADLVMDPKNPNKIIVAMWQHRRWPWFFKSGGPSSGLYITYNGGKSWEKRTEKDGLPKGDLGRIGLAIAPSNPEIIYALVESTEKNALYKSTDGGFAWQKISEDENIGNRPFYYSEIYVAPNNPNKIYSLWTVLTASEDGGKSWKTIAPYNSVHPDHHAFWVGKNPDYLIEGNDGGLNISRDGGQTWRFVENLPLAQFYHIAVDNELPYNIYGGMQDNGSWRGPAYVWHAGGIRNSDWRELYFGDGFDVVPDPENPRYVYAQSQEGYVGRVDTETGYSKLIRPVHPDGAKLRYNWNAAIAQDPFSAGTIYFGSQFLHKSTDRGDSWQIISPDLTTNDTAHQHQLKSGGLTFDVTGAENYTTIISIAPSKLQKDVIWVGTDDGNVQVTKDGGQSWTNIAASLKGMPKGAWIAQIQPSTHNAGEAFIIANDYRRNDWKTYVFHTTDFGKTVRQLANSAPVTGYAMSIVQDPVAENLLFLGTETGLFYSLNKGATWAKWNKDFPTVQVSDLAIQARDADLVVGTFGRAAWVLDDLRPLRELTIRKKEILKNPITAFDAPDAYMAEYRQADGMRFAADAVYAGQNRPSTARLSFWVNKNETDSAYKSVEKIKVLVLNAAGDTVRNWQVDFVSGLNRITWDLAEKGPRFPSMSEPNKDQKDNDPGYINVLPGQYRVIFSYGPSADTCTVNVLADPRLNISTEDLASNQAFSRELLKDVAAVSAVADMLREAKKSIELIEKQLASKEGDDWKKAKEMVKNTKDSLELVRLSIFGKEAVKGYYEQPEIWFSVYGLTSYYVSTNRGAVGQNTKILASQLNEKTAEVVAKANQFISRDYAAFKTYFEENPLEFIAPLEPVKN